MKLDSRSEGLYAYDLKGKRLWKKDLGVLDAGWFTDPSAQWETELATTSRQRAVDPGRRAEGTLLYRTQIHVVAVRAAR